MLLLLFFWCQLILTYFKETKKLFTSRYSDAPSNGHDGSVRSCDRNIACFHTVFQENGRKYFFNRGNFEECFHVRPDVLLFYPPHMCVCVSGGLR